MAYMPTSFMNFDDRLGSIACWVSIMPRKYSCKDIAIFRVDQEVFSCTIEIQLRDNHDAGFEIKASFVLFFRQLSLILRLNRKIIKFVSKHVFFTGHSCLYPHIAWHNPAAHGVMLPVALDAFPAHREFFHCS